MTKLPSQYQILNNEYALVTEIQHPMVKLEGFSAVLQNEVLQFADGSLGQVVQFDGQTITAQVFSSAVPEIGSKVLRTGQELSVALSAKMAGHIFDPLGNPLDGNYRLESEKIAPIDITPPPLENRAQISEQFVTGLTVVDALLPLGRGQRELVIGDQHTGKESVLLNSSLTQARGGAMVVYALIGKPKAEVQRLKKFFSEHKMVESTVIVASSPNDAVSTIALTPFTAMTIAEFFRDLGRDVLVILDDLSAHAKFYRELSLLAKKFPGRDSYPGDIFYTHARLLERAGCFSGGNTITCLPAAETVGSDVTDYIVSNLISITDGHLLFDPHFFAEGQRPAINTALSVTRVGKQTQTQLGRDLNRELTSFMNNYYKTSSLTQFGSELSDESQKTLRRGRQLLELFTQPNTSPLPLEVQQVLVGMVWLGWFADEKEIAAARLNMLETAGPNGGKNQEYLAKLTQAGSAADFFKNLEKEKAGILKLCKL